MKKIILLGFLTCSILFAKDNFGISQQIVKDKIELNKQILFSEKKFSFNEKMPSKNKYLLNGVINKSIIKKDLEDLILASSILYENLNNFKNFNSSVVDEKKYIYFINYIKEINNVEIYDDYAIINDNIILTYNKGRISLKINNINIIDLYENKFFEIKYITNTNELLFKD